MSPEMSIEQRVKSQFAKVFSPSDWKLFKEMAEASLSEAAFLKQADFTRVANQRRLLARNSRKRLLIGIGAELLLKAIYLKAGYCINRAHKPPKDSGLQIRFKPAAATAAGVTVDAADTFTLNQLIDSLKKEKLVTPQESAGVTDGLNIVKVFRNKEGHVVTSQHTFDPASYRAIENALVALYEDAFAEKLTVHFSLASGERAAWKIVPLR
jgi:hypothetical protein